MNESLRDKIKMVKLRDIGHIFLFFLALIPAAVYKRIRPHLWLICEDEREARDNGYWFFRYLRTERPQVDSVYAVKGKGPEAMKVRALGNTVEYGSFLHWIYYLSAEVVCSSVKGGKPSAAVGYLFEVILKLYKPEYVFLQHGVIVADIPSLHREKCSFSLFCCGARPEYDYVCSTYGYDPDQVVYTGLCRFDSLHDTEHDPDMILIVPTWRMYLQRQAEHMSREEFCSSDYYRCWNAFLHDPRLSGLLEKSGKRAVFCMHRKMEPFESFFSSESEYIQVLPWKEADIGGLIRRAGILITDYSSVSIDCAYMDVPILYYQFDFRDFRAGHHGEGYYDYGADGFGPVCTSEDELMEELTATVKRNCVSEEKYRMRTQSFFELRDAGNCERTYDAVRKTVAGKKHGGV